MTHLASTPKNQSKHQLTLTFSGVVQGKGVRPGIYKIANELSISGSVQNTGSALQINAISYRKQLNLFKQSIIKFLATCGAFELIQEQWSDSIIGNSNHSHHTFTIIQSLHTTKIHLSVTNDLFACQKCLALFYDSTSPFYDHPFLACTQCGSRYTMLKQFPYDRINTADKDFPLCQDCMDLFSNTLSSHYYDMAFSCKKCGPAYYMLDCQTEFEFVQGQSDQLYHTLKQSLLNNHIVGIKGNGLYHIIGIANSICESKIRKIKQRVNKPFVFLFPDIETIQSICLLTSHDCQYIASQERPVLIVPLHSQVQMPTNGYIGVTLSPNLFYDKLLRQIKNDLINAYSQGTVLLPGLIYTSMNREGLPPIYKKFDAIQFCQTYNIHELYDHNREIIHPIEDAIVHANSHHPIMIRPGRGFFPKVIPIPDPLKPKEKQTILALGSHKFCSIALSDGKNIWLSHSLGSQKYWDNIQYIKENTLAILSLYHFKTETILYDIHPNQYIFDLIKAINPPQTIAVDHHHAHFCSTLLEHGLHTKALGVIFDGIGTDSDYQLRGADFLIGTMQQSHLKCSIEKFKLPGGDICEHEIFRTAISLIKQFTDLTDQQIEQFFNAYGIKSNDTSIILAMIHKSINTVSVSSMGRLFDGVAFLSGVVTHNTYQAEAPLKLMGYYDPQLACRVKAYNFTQHIDYSGNISISLRSMFQTIVKEKGLANASSLISTRFHLTICEMVYQQIVYFCPIYNITHVVLSGGTFQNTILKNLIIERLKDVSVNTYWNETISPGDYSISLGQIGYWLANN